jgi:heme-degrading monooxygenase HmoA
MFKRQQGFEGVLFLGAGSDCAVVSVWEDQAAVAALAASAS